MCMDVSSVGATEHDIRARAPKLSSTRAARELPCDPLESRTPPGPHGATQTRERPAWAAARAASVVPEAADHGAVPLAHGHVDDHHAPRGPHVRERVHDALEPP